MPSAGLTYINTPYVHLHPSDDISGGEHPPQLFVAFQILRSAERKINFGLGKQSQGYIQHTTRLVFIKWQISHYSEVPLRP